MKFNSSNNQKLMSAGALLLAAVVFFTVNILSNGIFKSYRFDLTEQGIYSLSDGSIAILKDIKEPIKLRYYYSKKLVADNPYFNSFALRVEELLRQYQRKSTGKLELEIIDPVPFTEAEDEAVNYGLQGVPIDNEGNEVYFGLVATNSTSSQEIIGFFQPNREAYLEYDITQLIYKLVNDVPQAVGIISELPLDGENNAPMNFMQQQAAKPWVIWEHLNQNFDVRKIDKEAKTIDSDIKVLILAQPGNLSDELLYAVDQFVMQGGHILAFLDEYAEMASRVGVSSDDLKGNLEPLLQSWGVEIIKDKVVAQRHNAKPVRYYNEGKELAVRYPLWIDLEGENLNREDILTTNLERITLATPGAINALANATTKFEPLMSSGDGAMLVDVEKLSDYKSDPRELLRNYEPQDNFVAAGRISGTIKSAFPEGLNNVSKYENHINQIDNSNIVLVADSDVLHDHFWINIQNFLGNRYGVPTSGNGSFVISAVENLSGSSALISIRNRGSYARPFDKVQELEIISQERFRAHEQALVEKLEATKAKLEQLEKAKEQENSLALNLQQKREEEAFRQELIATRKELRDVRHELNKDIELLEAKIKFFSIGFMPIVILLIGALVLMFGSISRRSAT